MFLSAAGKDSRIGHAPSRGAKNESTSLTFIAPGRCAGIALWATPSTVFFASRRIFISTIFGRPLRLFRNAQYPQCPHLVFKRWLNFECNTVPDPGVFVCVSVAVTEVHVFATRFTVADKWICSRYQLIPCLRALKLKTCWAVLNVELIAHFPAEQTVDRKNTVKYYRIFAAYYGFVNFDGSCWETRKLVATERYQNSQWYAVSGLPDIPQFDRPPSASDPRQFRNPIDHFDHPIRP